MNHSYPDNIAVIGGGRWARVITEVLCDMVPNCTNISIHSFNHSELVFDWVSKKQFKRQIQVSSDWPTLSSTELNAVIVANAACDHEKAVKWALSNGIPVIVEKPITLSAASSECLVDLALKMSVPFASAHVFLFSRYLETFSRYASKLKRIKFVNVNWVDPRFEWRYGEEKRYDESIPVFTDCLPHVVSIVGYILPDLFKDPNVKKVNCHDVGNIFNLEVVKDDIICNVHLERNGKSRERVVEIVSDDGKIRLDFSNEPGDITLDSDMICGDPWWDAKERPMASMLGAFLRWVSKGEYDRRLDVEIGLQANRLIDKIDDLCNSTN